ncbi:hypothetical protein PUN28_005775 [Cardiocondyla obscurior]|uniref:Uncharacterized protein n=1 Tax=Cardiocondyla obscurior TaxID=286306 RepID=A0AAW2G7I3_9HYME
MNSYDRPFANAPSAYIFLKFREVYSRYRSPPSPPCRPLNWTRRQYRRAAEGRARPGYEFNRYNFFIPGRRYRRGLAVIGMGICCVILIKFEREREVKRGDRIVRKKEINRPGISFRRANRKSRCPCTLCLRQERMQNGAETPGGAVAIYIIPVHIALCEAYVKLKI